MGGAFSSGKDDFPSPEAYDTSILRYLRDILNSTPRDRSAPIMPRADTDKVIALFYMAKPSGGTAKDIGLAVGKKVHNGGLGIVVSFINDVYGFTRTLNYLRTDEDYDKVTLEVGKIVVKYGSVRKAISEGFDDIKPVDSEKYDQAVYALCSMIYAMVWVLFELSKETKDETEKPPRGFVVYDDVKSIVTLAVSSVAMGLFVLRSETLDAGKQADSTQEFVEQAGVQEKERLAYADLTTALRNTVLKEMPYVRVKQLQEQIVAMEESGMATWDEEEDAKKRA